MLDFRDASPDDADAREILEEYFEVRAAGFPGGTYTPARPAPSVFTPPAGVFVLAGPVGVPEACGGVRRVEDGPMGVRYELKHLFVRPAGRGRGWGRMMLTELERRAISFGAAELVLDTHHTLEAAGALYARSGFVEIEPYNRNPNASRWYGKRLLAS